MKYPQYVKSWRQKANLWLHVGAGEVGVIAQGYRVSFGEMKILGTRQR